MDRMSCPMASLAAPRAARTRAQGFGDTYVSTEMILLGIASGTDSTAEAHEETRRNEDLNAGRESAQCGRNKADYGTDQKRFAAAGFIGEWADRKLPECHAYHEGAEGHRCGGIGGVELAGNRRQRGQVHVDTQRSDSGQRGKGDDNGGRNTEGNFNMIRVLITLLRSSL